MFRVVLGFLTGGPKGATMNSVSQTTAGRPSQASPKEIKSAMLQKRHGNGNRHNSPSDMQMGEVFIYFLWEKSLLTVAPRRGN